MKSTIFLPLTFFFLACNFKSPQAQNNNSIKEFLHFSSEHGVITVYETEEKKYYATVNSKIHIDTLFNTNNVFGPQYITNMKLFDNKCIIAGEIAPFGFLRFYKRTSEGWNCFKSARYTSIAFKKCRILFKSDAHIQLLDGDTLKLEYFIDYDKEIIKVIEHFK